MEANYTYCLTISISIVSCRQKEFCLVVALSVRLLGLAPWSDTYPDGIAQPWIRCSNIEIGNSIEGDMLTRSRCRKRDSPTSLITKKKRTRKEKKRKKEEKKKKYTVVKSKKNRAFSIRAFSHIGRFRLYCSVLHNQVRLDHPIGRILPIGRFLPFGIHS